MYKTLALTVALTACASDPPTEPRTIAPGDALTLKWSVGENRACEGCTQREIVECGHEVSHPCPYLLFTTKLGIEGETTVFGSATGGSDANGSPAENLGPWRDEFQLDGAALVLPQRGDDGGLRHATELYPSDDGYEGDVEWSLFNEAGYTFFHVEATFQ